MDNYVTGLREVYRWILTGFFTVITGSLFSQTTYTITDGSTTNQSIPIEPFYGYTYSEQIYLQSEIAQAGNISEIYLEYNGNSAWTDNIVVYMGHTSKSTFSGTTDWITSSAMTQVYNGTFSTTTTDGWHLITLDVPFNYNNTDNLVIAIDENTAGYHSSSDEFYCLAATDRALIYRNDATNPNPASPPTATYHRSYVPSLQLTIANPNDQTSTINSGALLEPSQINSIAHDTDAERLQVFDFSFQDPGSGDGLNTIIDVIQITQGSANAILDWTDVIQGAKLSGPDLGTDVVGVVNTNSITFTSNDMITIADGGVAETYTLSIWLNSALLGNTVDNDLLEFRISDAGVTTDASGSGFTTNAEESGNTGVAIDIDATSIGWHITPPINQLISSDFAVTAKTQDANGNIDTDATGTITISEAATGLLSSILDPDLTNSIANGMVTWTDLQYDTEENNVVLTLNHNGALTATNNNPGTNFISGTIVTVCPTGCDYISIQAAYHSIEAAAPISTAYIIELQSTYTDINEPGAGIDFDDVSGTSASNTITIRPASNVASALEIKFDPTSTFSLSISTAYLLEFDDADFITIDGRPGGIGNNRFITLENTADPSADDAGAVVVFTGDATNNKITYCNIYGETEYNGSAELGIVHYHRDNVVGNDNNDIDNCVIGDRPSGTPAEPWAGIVFKGEPISADNCDITNNQLYNIIGNDVGTTITEECGYIYIEGEVSNLNITGNSFYSTIDIDDDSGIEKGFILNETTRGLNTITISNNYFGSNAALAAGSELFVRGDGGAFYGIKIGASSLAGTLTISDNTFAQIEKQNEASFFPIYIENRATTNTVISGNTIQAIDRRGLGDFTAIQYGMGALGATVSISGNTINDIDLYGEFHNTSVAGNSGDPSYRIISAEGSGEDNSDVDISNNSFTDLYFDTDIISGTLFLLDNANELDFTNNTVGNESVDHDIEIHVDAKFDVLEMHSDGTGNFTITNNKFAEIWWSIDNFNDGGGANNYNGGAVIYQTSLGGGINLTIDGNIIKDMENGVGADDASGDLFGIRIDHNNTTGVINNNQIFNFHNNTGNYISSCCAAGDLTGIFVDCSMNITKNIIYGFTHNQVWQPTITSHIIGIEIDDVFSGNGSTASNIYNNVVLFNARGHDQVFCIYNQGDGTDIYHNTMQITGAATNQEAYCFYNNSTDGNGNFKNNNVQNLSTGAANSKCMQISTAITLDYNAYDYQEKLGFASGVSPTQGWTEWNSAGYDPNGINENVTIDAEGYATTGGWGGIDAGENIFTIVALDKNSANRDIAPWMGAYESATSLPVELISFSVVQNIETVLINWVTASELNNDFFVVEKSHDGFSFTEMERRTGAGNTVESQKYQVIDYHPRNGVNYYRLKQVDFDGSTTYSNTQIVNYNNGNVDDFWIFPNPANEVLNIRFDGMAEFRIVDVYGRTVESHHALNSNQSINIESLKQGVYFLEMITDQGKITKQFVKN